jgi:hypothetical protein
MARKLKEGLDYFPLDVELESDPRIQRLMITHGHFAFEVYVKVLMMIYKRGYYIESDIEQLANAIIYDHRITDKRIEEVINILLDCLKLGLLDKESADKGIITSKGIQKQFLASTQRRKEREHPYWLLSIDEEENVFKTYGSAESKKSINVDNKSTETGLMSTEIELMNTETGLMSAEVHKGKVKGKVKVKEHKNDKFDIGEAPDNCHYFVKCLIHDHLIDAYDINLDELNELFNSADVSYDRDLVSRVFKYTRKQAVSRKSDIGVMSDYFKKAFCENLEKMEGYDERMQRFFESINFINSR